MQQNMVRHLEIIRSVLPWPKVAVLAEDMISVYLDADALEAGAEPLGSISESEIRNLRIKGKGWTSAFIESLGVGGSRPKPPQKPAEPIAPSGPLVTVVSVGTPKKKAKKKGASNGDEEAGSGVS